VHDVNPGVRPSGLFWIEQVSEDAVSIEGKTAKLHIAGAPTTDNFFFLGPGLIPASASFDVTWTAFGSVRHLRPLSSSPTDPTNFVGNFRFANATASFSVFEPGFAFQSTDASSAGAFAEMGTERNGVFLEDEDE